MICKLGNGCQLGVGLRGDQRTERQMPIIAHPIKKQMKGQTSYQLLVVSPEVRKSRVKRKRSREMGMREGKKKTKLLLANCHMHYMTVFKHTAPQGPGESTRIWGPRNFSWGYHITQEKAEFGTLSSLVVRMS